MIDHRERTQHPSQRALELMLHRGLQMIVLAYIVLSTAAATVVALLLRGVNY